MTQGPSQEELEAQLRELVGLLVKLMGQAVPVDPRVLHAHLAKQSSAETAYAKIIDDLANDTSKHPYWGFIIKRPGENGSTVEVARVCVAKILDPKHPEYLTQLAAWTNTYMLATTPMARACWTALGLSVEFYQAATPPKAQPALRLV